MARLVTAAVVGKLNGRIGNVVLYKRRNTGVARQIPTKRKKKALSRRDWKNKSSFGLVSHFFRGAGQVLKLGYQVSRTSRLTGFNAAISYHLENAVHEENEEIILDLSKVKLSKPLQETQQVWNPVLSAGQKCSITVNWELTPDAEMETRLDDKLILTCYNYTRREFVYHSSEARRADLESSMTFDYRWPGHEVHVFIFLVSEDGKRVSKSEYLGMVTLR